MSELRSLITELKPTQLETDGIAATLTTHLDLLSRAHDLPIDLTIGLDTELEPRVQRELFRIVQESLHNIVRHAGATRAQVSLCSAADHVELVVSDDGKGFDPGDRSLRSTRLGLSSMRHRARALGGRLEIRSSPGQGTTIRLRAPSGS